MRAIVEMRMKFQKQKAESLDVADDSLAKPWNPSYVFAMLVLRVGMC